MNYIPQIAKMLGVEMGERFKIKGTKRKIDTPFYFAEDGFHNEESQDNYSIILTSVLCGKYEIKKLPWKPKKGEIYYFPCVSEGIANYNYCRWLNSEVGIAQYNAGLVCRTEEEALEKAKKMLAAVKDEH